MSKEIRRNSWEWLCPSLFVNAGGGAQSYSANSKEIWLSRGNNMPSCNTNHDTLSQWKNCSKSSTNQYVLCIPNITYDIGVIIHDKGLVWSSTNAPTKERILYIVVLVHTYHHMNNQSWKYCKGVWSILSTTLLVLYWSGVD